MLLGLGVRVATGWAIFANNLRLDARRGMFSVEGKEQVVVQGGGTGV